MQTLEHLEYLKQKAVLENPLCRWQHFDWNISSEINAFIHRLGVRCSEPEHLQHLVLGRVVDLNFY